MFTKLFYNKKTLVILTKNFGKLVKFFYCNPPGLCYNRNIQTNRKGNFIMLWEDLRCEQFEEAVRISKGVCVVPIGCLEKHGQHLPSGTDSLNIRVL